MVKLGDPRVKTVSVYKRQSVDRFNLTLFSSGTAWMLAQVPSLGAVPSTAGLGKELSLLGLFLL